MKKLAIISFTERGSFLCSQLEKLLSESFLCEGYCIERYADKYGLKPVIKGLPEWTREMFESMDSILFIGAAGIAVRAIAPFVKSKVEDPAIVVMDEKGMFVISLLSGHLGGANELAGVIANHTGAMPVITTATDVNGRFAVDLFAKKNNLYITDMNLAKEISAQILDEQPIGLFSELAILGEIPEELIPFSKTEVFEGTYGISISKSEQMQPYKKTLQLVPKCITAGIGCRKGKSMEEIESLFLEVLKENHMHINAVRQIASVDLKKEEPGIKALCEKYQLPFATYDSERLSRVEGEFETSDFVKEVAGVDNVCERSAVLAGGNLIQKKRSSQGVTIALAMEEWSVKFE